MDNGPAPRLDTLIDIRIPATDGAALAADLLLGLALGLALALLVAAILRPVHRRAKRNPLRGLVEAASGKPDAERVATALRVLQRLSLAHTPDWPAALATRFGARHVDLPVIEAARRGLYTDASHDPGPVETLALALLKRRA